MNKPKFVSLMAALSMLMLASQALAHPGGSNQPSPNLPPVIPDQYMTPQDVHARYSGPALEIVLSMIEHTPFNGVTLQPPGPDERHHMDSLLEGDASCTGDNCPVGFPPQITMQGPLDTVAFGRSPGQLGTFDTEMLSMSLSMGPSVMIRESPTKASTGKTTITQIGPGLYHIDSFFDVFTELSLSGPGGPWMPSNMGSDGESHPTRVYLGGVPEPASAALLAMGLIGGAGLFRRRR